MAAPILKRPVNGSNAVPARMMARQPVIAATREAADKNGLKPLGVLVSWSWPASDRRSWVSGRYHRARRRWKRPGWRSGPRPDRNSTKAFPRRCSPVLSPLGPRGRYGPLDVHGSGFRLPSGRRDRRADPDPCCARMERAGVAPMA